MLWPNGSKTRPYVSSPFGPRSSPGGGASTYHRGVDFTGFSEVRAVAAGTVVEAGTPSGWGSGGNQVWIQHDGFFTRSMHLSSTSVHAGQPIEEGAVIGIMGATGTAYGVHLHLELSPGAVNYGNSSQIDPVPFIEARLNQEEEEDMPTAQEIADAVWNRAMTGGVDGLVGTETAQERLLATRRRVQRLYDVIGQTGTFFKHADLTSSDLWIYVLPNGDFVRITDQTTAALYKERAGGSIPLSAEAIRLLVADLEKAGGRDLSQV